LRRQRRADQSHGPRQQQQFLLRHFARNQHDQLCEANRDCEREPGQSCRREGQQHAEHYQQADAQLEAQSKGARRGHQHQQQCPGDALAGCEQRIPLGMRRQATRLRSEVRQRTLAIDRARDHRQRERRPPDRRRNNSILAP
jgi:hypothetical protein